MENFHEFFQTNNGNVQFRNDEELSDDINGSHFIVEDLLDFPNDDGDLETAFTDTPVDGSCNSSLSGEPAVIGGPHAFADGPFFNEHCIPNDDLAELEWLSTFVDESFASEDLQKLQLIDGTKAQTNKPSESRKYQFQPETTCPGPMLRPEILVPAKARSKRSRAAPGNWASRLLVVSPTPTGWNSGGGEGRKCLHCATDKTPQWRTGPLGPKTLCNACGVRYKSGRLVQEYRPAASPTFVLTKHSNSHRKVLELRRQKEMVQHQNVMFGVSNGEDYLIHQHVGHDYRTLI